MGVTRKPAVSLAAVPGRRKATIEFAQRFEKEGFSGIYGPSLGDGLALAEAVALSTHESYVKLPNYQNYWIEAGFEEEMQAIRRALATGRDADVSRLMSDRWLAEVTLFGSPAQVRGGVEAWYAAGVRTLILVPSSTRGNQMVALQELLDLYR